MALPYRAHWSLYALVGTLTTAVLAYGVVEQVFDTNFYVLWEATALLAGDHPYRDFFQTGWPLLTAVSTLVQWLSGYRLIGEFVVHWTFIVASMVIAFHMAVRLSGSPVASLASVLVAIVILLGAPTFQFPKMFFYPCAVLAGWWYMERPSVRRAAALGAIAGLAFLFRHDHGLYIGVASVLAFALARLIVPASRGWRGAFRDATAYGLTAAALLAPWAVVVQVNEGLVDYVRTRAAWGETWAPAESPYRSLVDANPLRMVPIGGGEFRLPPNDTAVEWLFHLTMLVPVFILGLAAYTVLSRMRRGEPTSLDSGRCLLAAALATFIAERLLRQPSYYQALLPLTAVLGARLLTQAWRAEPGIRRALGIAASIAVFLVTTVAAIASLDRDLFAPSERAELRNVYGQLLAAPPIDAYQPAEEARRLDAAGWEEAGEDFRLKMLIRYMHDCTTGGDRLFVTGSTPYQVGYLAERPIAGGHLQWAHGWRSDPPHEAQSLALLERQSVPFAVSTHDPVFEDLAAYPRILEHFTRHYVELEGTGGRLLIDTRRRATSRFGRLGLPCFS